ncbi:hypothetical protein AB4Z34_36395, partial [Ensifer sp. 2YAB10]|uniref:hypothetical protein n=1 Tax=Ensifer sp. 2YAB10 TaxID=3233021 RepID=UPI003F8E31E1
EKAIVDIDAFFILQVDILVARLAGPESRTASAIARKESDACRNGGIVRCGSDGDAVCGLRQD